MKIRVGSIVLVRGGFGMEPSRKVTVEGLDEKDGKPLFDYDEDSWAYTSQIIKVIKYWSLTDDSFMDEMGGFYPLILDRN